MGEQKRNVLFLPGETTQSHGKNVQAKQAQKRIEPACPIHKVLRSTGVILGLKNGCGRKSDRKRCNHQHCELQ